MGAKGKWVRRSAGEQRAMVAKFAGSGMAAAAFCRREAISVASLRRWRSLHGDGGLADCVPSTPIGREPPSAFVDLGALSLPATGTRRLELKLDLGEGLVLHLVRG
ncbi:MAG: IS66 family insertion sequence element accessory protein TnpB [Polyangiaceae bacterium]